jgi:ankyrin repeat protein
MRPHDDNYRELPVAETVEIFLEHPDMYFPRPEFLTINYLDDETVLTHAIKTLNTAAVQALLEAKADPNLSNRKGVTPMSGAAHKGNTLIMKCLLDAGADVNSLNTSGSTALIQASHFGWHEAVRFLLSNHAYSDFANNKGTTALMRSAQEGHLLISELLIEAGADVNKKNNEGMNALMLASQRGHANMAMLLIHKKALMDEQTSQGSTALMLACKRGHQLVVEALVCMGAEIFMRDSRGRTALDTAIKRQHPSLLAWLDTQVQKRKVSEGCRGLRTQCLLEMRAAHSKGKLQLSSENQKALDIIRAVRQGSIDLVQQSSEQDLSFAVHSITSLLSPPVTGALPPTIQRQPGHAEWYWPLVLHRCMDLPDGVFELIVDFLPLPRIWHWSLLRLKRRCRFAPKQAITDVTVMLDEMLTDLCIFGSNRDQTLHLMRLSHQPLVQAALVSELRMPTTLVNALVRNADAQSINDRTGDNEVTFKPIFASAFLNVAVELFRYICRDLGCRCIDDSLIRLFLFSRYYREVSTTSLALCLHKNSRNRDSVSSLGLNKITDLKDFPMEAGMLEEDEDDTSDGEAPMDQDSETDMQIDGDADLDLLDSGDEDNDGMNQPMGFFANNLL